MGSLLKDIKTAVKNSGSNKSKMVYFKADNKVRVRFLNDVEDGIKVTFHDSFALGINEPCQEIFGRTCHNHDNEDLRTRDLYAWSVYDYDANEVKIILAAVNNCSPVPALIGMYESYGTLTDRDYILTRTGSGTNTTYSVVPMDKAPFKNKKAKPLTQKQMLEIIDKAHPAEGSEDFEKKAKGKKKPKPVVEEEEEDDEEIDVVRDLLEDLEIDDLKKVAKALELSIPKKYKNDEAKIIDLIMDEDENDIQEAYDELFSDDNEEDDEEDEW